MLLRCDAPQLLCTAGTGAAGEARLHLHCAPSAIRAQCCLAHTPCCARMTLRSWGTVLNRAPLHMLMRHPERILICIDLCPSGHVAILLY